MLLLVIDSFFNYLGVGLKGGIASVAVIDALISLQSMQQLLSLGLKHFGIWHTIIKLFSHIGPTVSLPIAAITVPQSSFDTGHMALGTRLTKVT